MPGTDAYAGYLMAAAPASWRAGAHASARRAHPRDAADRPGDGRRARLELWRCSPPCCWPAGAWFSRAPGLAVGSFHDISTSNDATPLWIPQIAMALGRWCCAIAFVDELVLEGRGSAPPAMTRSARAANE